MSSLYVDTLVSSKHSSIVISGHVRYYRGPSIFFVEINRLTERGEINHQRVVDANFMPNYITPELLTLTQRSNFLNLSDRLLSSM